MSAPRWLRAPQRIAAASLIVIMVVLVYAQPAGAQVAGLKAPGPAGSHWEVLAGYNTATHEGVDPYALDLWRRDAETGGTPVLAPMSGTIGYTSDTCVSVRTSELNLLLCHVFIEPGLDRGDPVAVGQKIATVAPDGQAENNGIAHIHLQLNRRTDGPGSTGESLPFSGAYAIEGVNLEPTTEFNAHYQRGFVSTNAEVAASGPAVDAGADRQVQPGEMVTLTGSASGVTELFWVQESGPPVIANINQGGTYSFVAPSEPGAVVKFQLIGNADGTLVTDAVTISVQASAPPAGQQQQVATIVGGQVFPGGISMVVFSGGTTDQLIQAVACPRPTLAMWASAPNGNLVQYTVGRPAFVNAAWTSLFPNGLPELTPLLLRCE
ncbi:MAG: hypothetical protein AB7F65_10915 [Dehalococcoidia bacterium]